MKLFFSNQRFAVKKDVPTIVKVKAWLDRQKNGELFGTRQVMYATGVSAVLDEHIWLLEGTYAHKYNRKWYLGNKATITKFRKELEKHVNN